MEQTLGYDGLSGRNSPIQIEPEHGTILVNNKNFIRFNKIKPVPNYIKMNIERLHICLENETLGYAMFILYDMRTVKSHNMIPKGIVNGYLRAHYYNAQHLMAKMGYYKN